MSIADHLQQRWYGGRAPFWWTLPLASLYGAVVAVRRGLYHKGWLRSQRLPVPVIVVGNIVVGGAGKTPLVIALVEALRRRGWKPGVVSRGYGGNARGSQLLGVRPDPSVAGDEPALIANRTDVPVAIGADRPAAAELLTREGVDVVVADDGLQHYALGRDIEICVIDGARRLGNGRLLPAGPLREPASRLHEVDFVVCNGGKAQAGEIPMRLVLADSVRLDDSAVSKPLAGFAGSKVHAVAGIGHPSRFFESLREAGIDLVVHAFPDHHRYAPSDLGFGDDLPVLMTEKDAIKCRVFARQNWWSVPVTAQLPESFLETVAARLQQPEHRPVVPPVD